MSWRLVLQLAQPVQWVVRRDLWPWMCQLEDPGQPERDIISPARTDDLQADRETRSAQTSGGRNCWLPREVRQRKMCLRPGFASVTPGDVVRHRTIRGERDDRRN